MEQLIAYKHDFDETGCAILILTADAEKEKYVDKNLALGPHPTNTGVLS
jgi:hypothetical protein